VVRGTTILSSIIASQTELHKPYGGVFPTVAKQAHRENIAPTVALALRRAGLGTGLSAWSAIDAIAVTQGPGLAPALEVGIGYAKELATVHHKPLLPINHIEGHLLSVLAQPRTQTAPAALPNWPVLSLIISGGHSEFELVTGIGQYQRLGWTIDDAAGECLDKVGRMLNLGYPAGPVIEKFAKLGNPTAYDWPLPMTSSGDFNLSFSGLKTAARNRIAELEAQARNKTLTRTQVYDLTASFQTAVFRHITHKLTKILAAHPEINEVWLGGGVAANMALRKTLRTTIKPLLLRVPYTKKLCQDNAAMIGVVGAMRIAAHTTQQSVPPLTDSAFERRPNLQLGL
jgi:N6-L-threonylcarbamoyladenine synthase